jgi:hypothetical protein
MWDREPPPEVIAYAMMRGLVITGGLGDGNDGNIWTVRRKGERIPWALKMHVASQRYGRERDCYLRLDRRDEIAGFNVPILLRADDEWKVIEMSIVCRPFVLDFAQAFLDSPPDFPDEVWQERLETWRENYGDDWPDVQRALAALRAMGIHYLDVHHGNISLA